MDEDKLIDGKKISLEIKEEVKKEVTKLKESGIIPGIAFILVGENPASVIYVRNKEKTCLELGFYSKVERLPENIPESELLSLINQFNNDKSIHGILVQLPLPNHLIEQIILESINYKKDVDGLHPQNIGRLVAGMKSFIPCTHYGIVELIKRSKIETKGKNVVVLGRSNLVGKPIGNLFLHKSLNSTVTFCHSATQNIEYYTKNADIIILAMGKSKFLKSDMIKKGVIIIDVGINRVEDANTKSGYKLVGDADFDDCFEKCGKITPVPGGVGPMTIVMLMKNTLNAAQSIIYPF